MKHIRLLLITFSLVFTGKYLYAGAACSSMEGYVVDSAPREVTPAKLVKIPSSTTRLNVSNSQLTVDGLATIARHFRWLTHLSLYECSEFSANDLVTFLQQVTPTITHLNLGHTELSPEALTIITNKFRNLCFLSIVGYKGNLAPLIENIPDTVEHLDLSYTTVTAPELTILINKLHCVKSLSINGCRRLSKEGLNDLLAHLPPTIEHLDLEAVNLSDTAALTLNAEHLPRLRHLAIKDQFDIPEDVLCQILMRLPPTMAVLNLSGTRLNLQAIKSLLRLSNLRELDITHCLNFAQEECREAFAHLPESLESITITGINLTADALALLNHRFSEKQLTRLTLGGCWNIQAQELGEQLAHLPNSLNYLKIISTHLDDAGVGRILKRLQDIVLSISDCQNVTTDAFQTLEHHDQYVIPLNPFE